MRFGGRLVVVIALLIAAFVGGAQPASAKVYQPEIQDIDGPIPSGSQFQVEVSTLSAGAGAQVSLQMYQRSAWRTLGRQSAGKYVGTRKFTVTAPATTQTLMLRAVLTRGKQHLSTSKTSSIEVWRHGLTPTAPYEAQASGRPGQWFRVGKDELLFGPTLTGAEAWKVVSPDVLVEKPAPGWSIVLGTVNYKTPADQLGHLWPSIAIEYQGSDGNVYRPKDELSPGGYCRYSLDLSLKTGDPKYDLYPLDDGAFPQFYPCAVVPDQAIAGGVWRVKSMSTGFRPAVQYAQATATPSPTFPKGLTPLNPYDAHTATAQGDWFEIPFYAGRYGVRFGQTVTGEEAWNQVNGPYNSVRHPAPGWSIVLVYATLQNRTDQSASPFMNIIGPDFVGGDGVRYVGYESLSPGGSCPWTPSRLYGRTLGARASFEFTGCAVVPETAIAGGVWQIGPFDPFVIPSHVYVQAAR